MKYAISVLRLELSALKSHMRMVADAEFKMKYAGQIDEIEKAIKHLRQVNQKCEWKYSGDGTYGTNCGDNFPFIGVNLKENDYKFCPYCGREIEEVKHD